jgi:RNA polymerase sigma-70 factor (ECF subfamily)
VTVEPPIVSDEVLACEAQAGSSVAFEQLISRYETRIFTFVRQFCPGSADAAEITQDTFVKAYRGLPRYDAKHHFGAWLFTIARRRCVDWYRAAPPASTSAMPELVEETDPAEVLAQREDAAWLWERARARLPEHQFQALWLHYVEEMDVAQIAVVLGKTRVHVKVLLFRARQRLGRELGAERSANRGVKTTTAAATELQAFSTK